MILTHHARLRLAQRAPGASSPEDGVRIPINVARRIGIHGGGNAGARARAIRHSRKARRNQRPSNVRGGKPTYWLTASAVYVCRQGVVITVVELSEDDLAAALVWAAMGVWP